MTAEVEFVDIFPTLTEMAGLAVQPPRCPEISSTIPLCTEGASLVNLIQQVAETGQTPSSWKNVAFTQFLRGCGGDARGLCILRCAGIVPTYLLRFPPSATKAAWATASLQTDFDSRSGSTGLECHAICSI